RTLVNDDLFEMANADAIQPHPWFRSVARSAVSDALEIVTQPDLFYHPLRSPAATDLEPVYPLCSQAVVELCLRIPSYTLMHGGCSRGLAREAFKADLPGEIFSRYWKDAGQSLAYQLIRESGAAIREFLLDGILIQK